MRRTLAMAALVLAVTGTTQVVPTEAYETMHHNPGPCDIHWNLKPRGSMHEEIQAAVRKLIRCAVRRWDVEGGPSKALCIARLESGYWPWASKGTSNPNKGVYQHNINPSWGWAYRAHKYLKARWFPGSAFPDAKHPERLVYNARANVLVSIRMAHRNGWGPWSTKDRC